MSLKLRSAFCFHFLYVYNCFRLLQHDYIASSHKPTLLFWWVCTTSLQIQQLYRLKLASIVLCILWSRIHTICRSISLISHKLFLSDLNCVCPYTSIFQPVHRITTFHIIFFSHSDVPYTAPIAKHCIQPRLALQQHIYIYNYTCLKLAFIIASIIRDLHLCRPWIGI